VAGLPEGLSLEGEDDLHAGLMSSEGVARLRAYLESHPPQSVMQRRKIVSAFLDKFALPERIDQEIEMPGWTADMVTEMTQAYEADVARIAQMGEITFLAP